MPSDVIQFTRSPAVKRSRHVWKEKTWFVMYLREIAHHRFF